MAQQERELAEIRQRLMTDSYESAVVLVTNSLECRHCSGPIERYFQANLANSSSDLVTLAHPEMRTALRLVIQQSIESDRRVTASGIQVSDLPCSFSIDVRPISYEGEKLLLVCIGDDLEFKVPPLNSMAKTHETASPTPRGKPGPFYPERSVESTSIAAANQSSEPESSMPIERELQFLTDELSAVNAQLRAARERERVARDDLQSLMHGVDIAALFLDASLNIRFFTPAIRSHLRLNESDIGRPLSVPLLTDALADLTSDARTVLQQHKSIERKIETEDGRWCTCRIFPYRSSPGTVEGVVIAFVDVTELKLAEDSLAAAKKQTATANLMRAQSLAAVSYYLREPLHSLALLQGLLEKKFEGDAAQKMAALLDQTLSMMSSMLNTLVDVDQLHAGAVGVEMKEFPVNNVLARLEESFAQHAKAQGLDFRVVPSSLFVRSDLRLLEQTMRTLLINALKNTTDGKILLGCRRRGSILSIEILGKGLGIPENQLQTVLAKTNSLHGAMPERSRVIGLAVAQRLCSLLGHRLKVRSSESKTTILAIEVPMITSDADLPRSHLEPAAWGTIDEANRRTGTVLVIEDDSEACELLELFLKEEGHAVATARDEMAALEMMARGSIRPDLILADYRLLHRAGDLHITTKLEERLLERIPMIVLIGDIAIDGAREIAFQKCVQLNKPVRAAELTQLIQRLLPLQPSALADELDSDELMSWRSSATGRLKHLTERQHQIMKMVLAGCPSKNIAADLGISRRTVENHRASIMRKTGAKSIPELARMALAAARRDESDPKA